MIQTSPYDVAARFIGMREVPGSGHNPMILAMLKLRGEEASFDGWPESDEVPWCSGFVGFCCWILNVPGSKSLRARSWLLVGRPIGLEEARAGGDVVVFKRGGGSQPGPEVIEAPGHVAFFAGLEAGDVLVLGGNQSDSVSIARYPRDRVLGVRRLVG